jgi:hypothetical protein
MNLAQKSLIWREWAKASAWLVAHGMAKDQLEAKRHQLIAQANGAGLSMSNWQRWTNSQVDKVLAKFRAVYDGGNLNAQLAAEEQPAKRAGKAEAILRNLVAEVYPHVAGEDTQYKWNNHIEVMARKVCKKRFDQCSDAEIYRLIGIFKRQLTRNETETADAIADAHAGSDKIDVEEYLG